MNASLVCAKKTLRQGGCFGCNIGHKNGLDDTNIRISHLDRLDFGVQKVVGQRSSPGSMPRNEVERVSCFCSWHKEGGASKKETKPKRNQMKYPPKTKMTMENPPGWRCVLYWTPGSSNVMLVFRGGPQWSRMTGGMKFWLISKMFGLPDYHYRLWRGHGS